MNYCKSTGERFDLMMFYFMILKYLLFKKENNYSVWYFFTFKFKKMYVYLCANLSHVLYLVGKLDTVE